MGVEVDSVIVDLEARIGQYRQNMQEAIGLQRQFQAGWGAPANDTAAGQSAAKAVQVVEQADAKITRSRKKRAADSIAADDVEVASAKAAAKAKADAEIAEAQRSARLSAVAQRAADRARTGVPRGSGRNLGATVPREPHGQASIPTSLLNGADAEVAAETEINHLLVDRASLQSALVFSNGRDRDIIRDKLGELRLIDQLQKAGLDEAAIAVKLEERALAIETERAAVARRQASQNLTRFAEGAGIGRSYGSVATVGGIAAAAAVGVGAAAVSNAVEFAKALKAQSEELGVSTTQLQVYRKAALDLGVTQEQLTSAFGQFNTNLGKAQDGSAQQSKVFAALGISIKDANGELRDAGAILPVVIDRLSSIKDTSQRAAVEVALFGEEGRKLDGLLSGGADAVANLADGMERAGSVLSPQDVDTLAKAGVALSNVKQQLEVSVAEVVAGNASAIEDLATSFAHLITRIEGAIVAIQNFNSQQIRQINGNDNGTSIEVPALVKSGQEGANGFFRKYVLPYIKGGGVKASGLNLQPDQYSPEARAYINSISGADKGKVDQGLLSKLFAPKPPKGRKSRGPTDEQKAADLAAREEQLEEQRLAAIADLTQSAEDRAAAADAALDAERAEYARSLANDKKLTEAQRKELLAKEDVVIAEKRKKVAIDKAAQIAEDELRLRQADRTAYLDELRSEEALAQTAAERRRLELAALRTQQAAEVDAAQTALKTNPQGSAAYLQAQADLDPSNPNGIGARYGYAKRAVDANTRGPLGDYLASLPRTADQLDEALQQAAVNGLQSLNDGLSTAVDKFLHLHGIAGQFLSDLIKIGIERELLIPLADSLFPGKSGGGTSGGSGLVGSIIGAIGSAFGGGSGLSSASTGGFNVGSIGGDVPFAFANGGSGIIGGNPGVDRNILSINGNPVAKVGHGELLSVMPANARAAAPMRQNIVVVQPITADFSGARTDEQTMREFTAYADARSRQAYQAAVDTAGQQVGPIVQRQQKLEN